MTDELTTPEAPIDAPDAAAQDAPAAPDAPAPPETRATPETPATPRQPKAASDDGPRPAEPVSESSGVIDPAGLSASEAAAIKRAETAAAVALVAAVAASKASAVADAAAQAEPDEVPAPARPTVRRRLLGVFAMVLRGALVLALFVGGYALGQAAFRNQQPDAPAAVVDPSTVGVEPPAVVREFIGALGSGNADALRSSLQAEPHARLTSEFRRFDIQSISGVQTLSTQVDGPRSATEIVMQGTTTSGVPISLNLVVLADGNTIEGFR